VQPQDTGLEKENKGMPWPTKDRRATEDKEE